MNADWRYVGPKTNNTNIYVETLKNMFKKGDIDLSLDLEAVYTPNTVLQVLPKYDELCILMPFDNDAIQSLLTYANPFQGIYYAMMFIIFSLCIVFNLKLKHKFPNNILVYVFFGGPVPEHRKTFIERYITVLVVVFFATFNGLFLLNLTNLLTVQEGQPRFGTFKEYVESNSPIKLMVPKSVSLELVQNYPSIAEKLNVVDDNSTSLNILLLNETKSAFFISCQNGLFVELSSSNYDFNTGQRLFYLLKQQHFVKQRESYIFELFSPFQKKFVEIWYILFESGIDIKWESYYKSLCELYSLHLDSVNFSKEVNRLSVKDLIGMWVIYAIGVTLSFLVFLVELFCGKKSRRNRVEALLFRENDKEITDLTIIIYRYTSDLRRYSFSNFQQCAKFGGPRRASI